LRVVASRTAARAPCAATPADMPMAATAGAAIGLAEIVPLRPAWAAMP